ncbi:MAG: hypothetical protein NTX88_11785 [Candidatus Atribacteria bacterium]|nr:hypothetical protein [Candidatus Atribacteria bacterium]
MNKTFVFFSVICALVLLLSFSVFAQDEKTLLRSAMDSLQAGDIEKTQQTLDQVQLILWNQAPMKIENVTFTEGESHSYGVYKKRDSNVFQPQETMYLYAEPKNFTIQKENGQYAISLVFDVNLYDKNGKVLVTKEAFNKYDYATQKPVTEIFLNLYFNLTVDPGEYFLEVILRDQFSGKTASLNLPFRK